MRLSTSLTRLTRFIITLSLAAGLYAVGFKSLQAQNPGGVVTTGNSTIGVRDTYASEQITVSNTAIGFTASTINPTCTDCPLNVLRATMASCTVATDAVRVLSSGTTPTASLGLVIPAGGSFLVYGYLDIAAFRAIRVTNDATMDCQYSRIP